MPEDWVEEYRQLALTTAHTLNNQLTILDDVEERLREDEEPDPELVEDLRAVSQVLKRHAKLLGALSGGQLLQADVDLVEVLRTGAARGAIDITVEGHGEVGLFPDALVHVATEFLAQANRSGASAVRAVVETEADLVRVMLTPDRPLQESRRSWVNGLARAALAIDGFKRCGALVSEEDGTLRFELSHECIRAPLEE